MIVTAADFMLYPLFTSIYALMTMSFILGLALGGCQPTMLSMLHQHSPAGRAAEAGGLRMALVNASQVMLPMICGAMGTVVGVTPLFWVYALMLSGGIWINRDPPVEAARPDDPDTTGTTPATAAPGAATAAASTVAPSASAAGAPGAAPSATASKAASALDDRPSRLP